jgi:N-acetylglucosaminyl-diphospho-decaprenol L-rhamnosyltransferase
MNEMREPAARQDLADLAVIIVSTNEASWLSPCLASVFARAGDIRLDVVVADNESTDGTRELVEAEFPAARVVTCENRGFAHANNRAYQTCDARYALFLNPDTEILSGTFAELVRLVDERPAVGLAGVRQVTADGTLFPTMRRFPNALRALGEAIGSDRFAASVPWLGERVPVSSAYDRETVCDWTSGSFMLLRREALESAGLMDERFFIYSEEPDLALRIRRAGWETRHLPQMTILHHARKAGINPRVDAQDAFARRQYAQKHFTRVHRAAYLTATASRYALRFAAAGLWRESRDARRAAAKRALRTLLGFEAPPYMSPPPRALHPRSSGGESASGAQQR